MYPFGLIWWNLQVLFLWPEGPRERFGRCSMISMGVLQQMSIGNVRSVFKKIMVLHVFAMEHRSTVVWVSTCFQLEGWISNDLLNPCFHKCCVDILLKDHTVTWMLEASAEQASIKSPLGRQSLSWHPGWLGLCCANAKAWAIDPVRFGARWLLSDGSCGVARTIF